MLNNNQLPYDKTDPLSIERYAQKLLGHSLKEVLGTDIEQTYKGKGKLGQILEELYFQYKPNSVSEADFAEAGVELKTSPIKRTQKGFSSKERLVFNIINYEKDHAETFFESNFWKKNKLILLMMYLYEKEKFDLDYIFKIIRLFEFPENDLKIIKDDWEKIISKIKAGKAHELSEGDTLYLGACTKGANKSSLRKQPFSEELAMQRAFSLKSKYLSFFINDNLKEAEPIVKNKGDYTSKKQTFEELVIDRFKPYYGMPETEIARSLNVSLSTAKNRADLLCRAILGVKTRKIEEFEKADIIMKTIKLEESGALKESMSFAQIQFKEIVNEEWEDSYLYETLTRRFFFIVFQQSPKGLKLKQVKFWTMPNSDLEKAKKFWLDTKKKILRDDYNNFIKISDDALCHVRPKGKNALDLMETPTGRMEKKKSYWLNSSYIKSIIK